MSRTQKIDPIVISSFSKFSSSFYFSAFSSMVLSFPQVKEREIEQATYVTCLSWTITARSYLILRVLRIPDSDNAHSDLESA